jgi:hypothetical protein
MPYQVKILKIAENKEWQPNPANLLGGASPDIEGAWLATRVTVETSNMDAQGNPLSVLEVRDLLVPEPYSTQALVQVVNDYKATLPVRNEDEGLIL